jgi:hypothetical protein
MVTSEKVARSDEIAEIVIAISEALREAAAKLDAEVSAKLR